MKGTVKFFNDMKGFGFISGEDGKDYFVHQTDLREGVALHDNDAVTFDVTEGDRGPKATNVELDSEGSSDEAQEETQEATEEESAPEEEAQE
jgi:cold shock protein